MMRTSPAEVDYGNARIRARRTELLPGATLRAWAGKKPRALLSALADTPYREDVEYALARAAGLDAVHLALRQHQVRVLGALRSFYGGRSGKQLTLMLRGFDRRNLTAVLRGHARGTDPAFVSALLVPAGDLDGPTLDALVAEPTLRAFLERLVAWRLPSPGVARAVYEALPAYTRHGDLAVLERALSRAFTEELVAGLQDPSVGWAVHSEADKQNLLTTLRLWLVTPADLRSTTPIAPHLLPAGTLPASLLESLWRQETREGILTELSGRLAQPWIHPVRHWASGGSLVTLSEDLQAAWLRSGIGRWRGDPLSLDLPVAYLFSVLTETRNLRVMAIAGAQGRAVERITSRLVLVD